MQYMRYINVKRKRTSCLCFLLCAALVLAVVASPATAAANAPVNWALYTDIVAEIEGHPLRSFNIDNHTAVVAEDLRPYGFDVVWQPETRRLLVMQSDTHPATLPDYTSPALTHPIGSRAKPIYATDIATYVAGQKVESFNIGGETLIWFSELASFGTIRWNPDSRTTNLTVGDPLQIALDGYITEIETAEAEAAANGFSGYASYDLYPGSQGTLFVSHTRESIMHTYTTVLFIFKSGVQIDITEDVLPAGENMTPRYYVGLSEVQFTEDTLTFVTPVVLEQGESSSVNELEPMLCELRLDDAIVYTEKNDALTMTPIDETVDRWLCDPSYLKTRADGLEVTVTREDGKIRMTTLSGPLLDDLKVYIGYNGFSVYHYYNDTRNSYTTESFLQTSYGQAYAALQAVRRTNDPGFDGSSNTPEEIAQIEKYVHVTKNGEPVAIRLFRNQATGQNSFDIDFEEDLPLAEGDTITVQIGA